eukprot:5684-Prymnesium_polylepis.1
MELRDVEELFSGPGRFLTEGPVLVLGLLAGCLVTLLVRCACRSFCGGEPYAKLEDEKPADVEGGQRKKELSRLTTSQLKRALRAASADDSGSRDECLIRLEQLHGIQSTTPPSPSKEPSASRTSFLEAQRRVRQQRLGQVGVVRVARGASRGDRHAVSTHQERRCRGAPPAHGGSEDEREPGSVQATGRAGGAAREEAGAQGPAREARAELTRPARAAMIPAAPTAPCARLRAGDTAIVLRAYIGGLPAAGGAVRCGACTGSPARRVRCALCLVLQRASGPLLSGDRRLWYGSRRRYGRVLHALFEFCAFWTGQMPAVVLCGALDVFARPCGGGRSGVGAWSGRRRMWRAVSRCGVHAIWGATRLGLRVRAPLTARGLDPVVCACVDNSA